MKNNGKSNIFTNFISKGFLAILGSFALISCGSIPSGYTEVDGIYYNPSMDKLERITMRETPNQVGEQYEYHTENVEPNRIIEHSNQNQLLQSNKYKNWGGEGQNISGSDWGTYTGTQNNYYNNYSWGYGYPYYNSFYSPYYFGGYNSYFGYGWNLGYHWNTTPYYYPYYYNPYYYNRYGYNYWYHHTHFPPYYFPAYDRRYDPFYDNRYYTPQRHYRRSGADPIYRGREANSNYTPQYNNGYRGANSQSNTNNSGNASTGWGRRDATPNLNNGNRTNSNDNGGYRNSNWERSNNHYQSTPNNNSWRNSSGGGHNNGSGSSSSGGFRRAGGF